MHMHEWVATFPKDGGPWQAEGEYRSAVKRAASGLTPLRTLGPLRAADIPLFVLVRNEELFLASFLDHYRKLGVTRFVVIDNLSTDRSLEILLDAPDVGVWRAEGSFSLNCAGRLWVDALALSVAVGRWAVFVDADELLVFPGMERGGLRALAEQLEAIGETRLLAPMIDVYGQDAITDTHLRTSGDPWAIPLWVDRDGYWIRRSAFGTMYVGGPRSRLFGKERDSSLFVLTKYPFEKVDRLALHPTPHSPLPFDRNPPLARGALIHLKLVSDLSRRIGDAIASQQYWMGSSDYKAYRSVLAREGKLSAWSPDSVRYGGPDDLVRLGLVAPPLNAPGPIPSAPPAVLDDDRIDFPLEHERRFGTVGNYLRAADLAAPGLERVSPLRAPAGPVTVVTVVHDEALLLPAFLAHYRRLGARRFIVVDHDSSDGTREILASEDDVELYVTGLSFATSVRGRLWLDGLARARAMGDWVLCVAADEFLVYDCMESKGLADLVGWMAARQIDRLFAPMVDLYPANFAAAQGFRSGDAPLSIRHHFDGREFEVRLTHRGPLVSGGVRDRIVSSRGRMPIELARHPVVRWDERTANIWQHTPYPFSRNQRIPYANLLHFKVLADLRGRSETLVRKNQQQWNQAQAYRQILDDAGSPNEAAALICAYSVAYDGPCSLIGCGLMAPIDWPDHGPGAAAAAASTPNGRM